MCKYCEGREAILYNYPADPSEIRIKNDKIRKKFENFFHWGQQRGAFPPDRHIRKEKQQRFQRKEQSEDNLHNNQRNEVRIENL